MMNKRFLISLAAGAAVAAGIVCAQQFPILDAVAGKVVQKYQGSTCEQLYEKKGQSRTRCSSAA
jgi:hypothetical protein